MAGDLEIGDPKLRPFWEKAEELRAVIYVFRHGIRTPFSG
jgi:hypothetical protein